MGKHQEKKAAEKKEAFFQYQLKGPAIFDFYQDEAPLDWDAIVAANPLRVAFQATFSRRGRKGDGKPDTQVANFIEQAKARGVKYGLYHFLTPNFITEQAEFYLNTVRSLGGFGDMEPIVDIEYEPDKKDKKAVRGNDWANQIKRWLDIVELACGIKPMIYTSAKYWPFACDRDGTPPSWTSEYRLWTAGYPFVEFVDQNETCPPAYIPAGWKKDQWAIWQYAEDGRFRKYPSNDLNLVSPEYAAILSAPRGMAGTAGLAAAAVARADMPEVSGKTAFGLPSFEVEAAAEAEALSASLISASVSSPQVSMDTSGEMPSVTIKFDLTLHLRLNDSSRAASGTGEAVSFNMMGGERPAATPRSAPPATEVATTRFAIVKHIPRDSLAGRFAPDTVPLADAPKGSGKGKVVPILPSWWKHIERINSPAGLKYARSVHMMWINIDFEEGQTPKAERITNGGNFVSILEEAPQHYRIDCFSNDLDTSSLDPAHDNWFERPELFFKAIAINARGDMINVARDLDVYFPLLRRAGDELWISKDKVETFPSLPVEAVVTADTLDTFSAPGPAGITAGACHRGDIITILEYRPMGASIWGRTIEGWIPLLQVGKGQPRNFSTSWRIETAGVIPPA